MNADIAGDYDGWPDNSGQALQVGGMTVNYTFENDEPKITDIKVGMPLFPIQMSTPLPLTAIW